MPNFEVGASVLTARPTYLRPVKVALVVLAGWFALSVVLRLAAGWTFGAMAMVPLCLACVGALFAIFEWQDGKQHKALGGRRD